MNVRDELLKLQDEKYQKFQAGLVPGIDNIIGVRIPDIKKIAKRLAKEPDWQKFKDNEYYEEIMIQGLLIGYANLETHERLEVIKSFVPQITNWAVCDVVCSNFKFTQKNKEVVWKFLQPYLKSDKEYEIRFGVVMLLNYFIDDEYVDRVLKIIDCIEHDGYYAKMAVAWALSICFVKQWDKTFKYFKHANLSKWVYNKSIQKACESLRISDERKKILKSLKKI